MMSDKDAHLGRLDRSELCGAHNDSVYTQTTFAHADVQRRFARALA